MLSRASSLVTIVSTLFNARTAACCALIGLRVLCKALHSHARPCAANSEANHSQHYVRNPCTTLRSEFFKRVILCFLSCEVCHALTCFFPCYDRLHSLQCTHRRMLRSDWSTRSLRSSTFSTQRVKSMQDLAQRTLQACNVAPSLVRSLPCSHVLFLTLSLRASSDTSCHTLPLTL